MKRLQLLCALLLMLWVPALNATEIIHFDLKQDGAATLVVQETRDGRKLHILIDTGHASTRADRGAGKVRELLNKRSIRELDAVIVTHIDADHAAGVRSLVEELTETPSRDSATFVDARGPPIRIRQLVWPGIIREGTGDRRDHKEFWSAIAERAAALQVPFYTPETGAASQLEPFGIDVKRMSAANARRSNDTSLVLTVSDLRTGVKHLLTGDMTQRSFAELDSTLPESVEILHAPHHGADPVLRQLLQRTKPRFLVVSANKANRFGHPPVRVLREIARFGHREDLREKERRRQAATALIIRSNLIDELITYTIDPDPPLGSSQQRRTRTSGDPPRNRRPFGREPEIPSDQRAVNAAHATLRDLTPKPLGQNVVRTVPAVGADGVVPLFYDQVLITGELGDVSFLDGELTSAKPMAIEAFLREMVWHELRYLTDLEVGHRTDWFETQAFLAARVADRFGIIRRTLTSRQVNRPLWLADIERIVARVKGWTTYTGAQMDGALLEWCQPQRASAFGRARLSNAAWDRLQADRGLYPDGYIEEHQRRTEREVAEPLRARANRRVGSNRDLEARELLIAVELIEKDAEGVQPRMTSEWAQRAVERYVERQKVETHTGGGKQGPKPSPPKPRKPRPKPPVPRIS